jgi:hypothetical protein
VLAPETIGASSLPMTAAAEPALPSPGLPAWPRLLLAGLAGGAVDFIYACSVGATKGRSVERVWQGVASGWIGKAARDGGWATSALGMATHFGIAIVMALTYAIGARFLPVLYRHWLACGLVYGFVLYGVMYRIVLALRFPPGPGWDGWLSVADIASHIGVALAIAYLLSRPAARR